MHWCNNDDDDGDYKNSSLSSNLPIYNNYSPFCWRFLFCAKIVSDNYFYDRFFTHRTLIFSFDAKNWFFFLAIYILSPLAEFLLSNAIKNISSTFNVVGKIVAGMLCNYFTLMYWNSLLVWTYLIQNENLCIKNSTRRLKIFKIKKFSSLIHRTFFSVLFSLYYINRKLKEKSFWFFHASKKKFFFSSFFLNVQNHLNHLHLVSFFF